MHILTLIFVSAATASSTDTLTPAIVGIVGVGVGSVLGFVGNIVTVLITTKRQERLEQKKLSQQHENDRNMRLLEVELEKRNRLRQIYARVLYAAIMFQKALAEMQFLFGNETKEERDKRISAYLTSSLSDWEKARVDLMLEESDDSIITAFNEVHDAFIAYISGLNANQVAPGTVSVNTLQSYKKKASEAVDKLKALLFSRLELSDKQHL